MYQNSSMTLIRASSEASPFRIDLPVKTFYVRDPRPFTPNSNYYFALMIGGAYKAHTNNFKKVSVEGNDFYELDFFVQKFTIPRLEYHCFAIIGFYGTPDALEQRGNAFSIKSYDIFNHVVYIKPDLNYPFGDIALSYQITYHDSPLTTRIRKFRPEYLSKNNIDNILGFASGMSGFIGASSGGLYTSGDYVNFDVPSITANECNYCGNTGGLCCYKNEIRCISCKNIRIQLDKEHTTKNTKAIAYTIQLLCSLLKIDF